MANTGDVPGYIEDFGHAHLEIQTSQTYAYLFADYRMQISETVFSTPLICSLTRTFPFLNACKGYFNGPESCDLFYRTIRKIK